MSKIIPKFLNSFQEDLENFYDIFKNFDDGENVDISGLENSKIKKYLKKIFKYLRLNKNDDGYSKSPQIHTFSLKKKIQEVVENSFFQEKESSSSSSDNEEKEIGSSHSKSLETSEKEKKEKEDKIIEKQEFIEHQNNLKKIEAPLNENEEKREECEETTEKPQKKIYGVQFISPEEKEKFLQESLPITKEEKPQREDWLKADTLQNIIDKSFGKLKKASNPQKPVPKYLQSLFDKEPDKLKYLQQEENEDDEKEKADQEAIKEYMKDYDKKNNRGKSLLEMHKEKQKEKKKKGGGANERRPFNRDTDIQVIRHDSKKIFSLVNDGDNSLGNRFKNSKWEKSFL